MSDRWDAQRRTIGALGVWTGTVGLVAPRRLAALLGVTDAPLAGPAAGDRSPLPVLVRLAAARNLAMGTALLVAPRAEPRRATEVALLLTALDGAAVLAAARHGGAARRSGVLAVLVLAVAAAGAVDQHRR